MVAHARSAGQECDRGYALPGLKIFAASLLMAAACLACGGGESNLNPGQTATPTLPVQPAALPPHARAMLEDVARLRGLPAPADLSIAFVTRAQLPAVIENTLTDDDRRWFAETTTLYHLLGYLGPLDNFLDIYRGFADEAVIGLYDPQRRAVWVVAADAAGGFDALAAGERATLTHEFVHALQDARFGLVAAAKRAQQDHDRDLAWSALVEGDAVAHERLFSGRSGMAPGGLHVLFADVGSSPAGIPAPIERSFRFPYTTGADWVRGLRERGGTAGIDRSFEAGPSTTAAILNGLPGEPPLDVPALPDLRAALGDGWRLQSGGALGEFEWQNFLLQHVRALEAARAAAGRVDDRYAVYTRGGDALLVANVRCRDAEAAAALRAALRTWTDGSGLVTTGRPGFNIAAAAGSNTMAVSSGEGRDVMIVVGTVIQDVESAVRALGGG